jgi:20S proteasome subunit alpha 4
MSGGYDRALTVFSPNGQLFQVEYALEAVKQGTTVVGVRGVSSVAIAVERKAAQTLQDPRTLRKVVPIDDHILCAFAGLNADARVLIDLARQECQSYRLSVEDAPAVEYVARFVAETQQRYTHKGGARPFGVSCLLVGPEETTGVIRLYQTDPSGVFYAYKASAIGRNGKSVSDWLEKKYPSSDDVAKTSELLGDESKTAKFCLEALLSVVDAKNVELWVYPTGQPMRPRKFSDQEILDMAKLIEQEQLQAAAVAGATSS